MQLLSRGIGVTTFLLVSLGGLTAISAYVHGPGGILPQTLTAIVVACLIDTGVRATKTGGWTLPTGALISALVIALLLPDSRPLHVPLVAASLAMGSKHLLRDRGANLFNPAALAIAACVFIFPEQLELNHASFLEGGPSMYYAQSHLRMHGWSFLLLGGHGWTGATSTVAVVAFGAVLVHKVRRGELVVAFLATYVFLFAGYALLTGQDIAVRLLLELFPTGVLFFAFFMLTDPATSPQTPTGLMTYGVLTAALCFGFRLAVSPVQSLLFALLAANLVANRIDARAGVLRGGGNPNTGASAQNHAHRARW